MSQYDGNDTVDAESVFDVDFTSNPMSVEKPDTAAPEPPTKNKANPFEGVEDALGLPRGSTKQGLAATKKEVKEISNEAKALKSKKDIIDSKEKLALSGEEELSAGFSIETLAEDRHALRDQYMELFRRGKVMLTRIENDINDLVNPEPADWASYQHQMALMLKMLDSIREALVMLRKEEEAHRQQTGAAPGKGPGGTTLVPGGEVVAEDAIVVTPQDTNSWLAKWAEEGEADVMADLHTKYNERLLDGPRDQEGDAAQ